MLTSEYAHAIVTYRTVALSGQQAIGTEAGTVYTGFSTPVINDSGKTAFQGFLAEENQPSIFIGTGLWSEGSGPLELVARTGDHAPGTEPGVMFVSGNTFSYPILNAVGQVAFRGLVAETIGDPGTSTGIWMGTAGQLNLVARTGDAAPGTEPGVTFQSFYADSRGLSFSFNASGTVAFGAALQGPTIDFGNRDGIWLADEHTLVLVARLGDPAPGMGDGTVYSRFSTWPPNGGNERTTPVLNDAGVVAFAARVDGFEYTGAYPSGVWLYGGNDTTLIAGTGQTAPGVNTDAEYQMVGNPVINNLGQLAFGGVIKDSNSITMLATWSNASGSMELIAHQGQPLPGVSPDATMAYLIFQPLINSTGETTVQASISGIGYGILSHSGTDWTPIVLTGDPATGTQPGQTFWPLLNQLSVNGHGQTAFRARTTLSGQSSDVEHGVWATDLTNQIRLIAKEGDLFDVNDDPVIEDLRTIAAVDFVEGSGGEDGRPMSFNDAGQLAFHLTFTDGTQGVFVATLGLPGDLDADGFVGITDLNLILENWNQTVPPGDALADANGDNFIGIADLNTVLGNWNTGTPPTLPGADTNIPEPATLILFLTLSPTLTRRR